MPERSLPFPWPSPANSQAVFTFPDIRFSLLTPRLIRIETSPNGAFDDRPSQQFWFREQILPPAQIRCDPSGLEIETEALRLAYQRPERGGLNRSALQAEIIQTGLRFYPLDPNPLILPGTARTLDKTKGPIKLQPGLLSRSGWVLIDDTPSLVFNDEGWLENRPRQKRYRDFYLLISGRDYKAALRDYQRIAGFPSLLPRYMLGNWWSRYWEYTQDEIENLVERFAAERIPLSVIILDMDWHVTRTGNACNGWTGYTWNRKLIPNPPRLLSWLHEHSLAVALNLHPAQGIYPHEECYPRAAQVLGMNPAKEEPIPFEIANPAFAHVYFSEVLHPLEEQGVDFWWIDWQQGKRSRLPGLDPLWWLNHLHFYDLGRSSKKRPVIFSRWGGAGNHRYPVGFSGDTVVCWDTLRYQPAFTASAANAAYGWWSHDIGGHMHGMEDGELYTRWVQFGVLSPIFRLHCTKDIFINRQPWAFDAEVLRITRQAMQFRHALLPYLYTLARRNEQEGLPPVTPLYYNWPDDEAAYTADGQYLLGDCLMAAPITDPIDPELRLSRHDVWFPPAEWYDFFSGERFSGKQRRIHYRPLDEIPLFACAGAIIPLQADVTGNGCPLPQTLDILVFPGADGAFILYEDDGISQAYQQGELAATSFSSRWRGNALTLEIAPSSGDTRLLPPMRSWRVHFRGVGRPAAFFAWVDGVPRETPSAYDPATRTCVIGPLDIATGQRLCVEIRSAGRKLTAAPQPVEEAVKKLLQRMRLESITKWKIYTLLPKLKANPARLDELNLPLSAGQLSALRSILTQATHDD